MVCEVRVKEGIDQQESVAPVERFLETLRPSVSRIKPSVSAVCSWHCLRWQRKKFNWRRTCPGGVHYIVVDKRIAGHFIHVLAYSILAGKSHLKVR